MSVTGGRGSVTDVTVEAIKFVLSDAKIVSLLHGFNISTKRAKEKGRF